MKKELQECFYNACEVGDLAAVIVLAGNKRTKGYIDVAARNNYALRKSVECGHLGVVKFLLFLGGPDITAVKKYALRKAAINGHLEMVKYITALPNIKLPQVLVKRYLDLAKSNINKDQHVF